MENFNRPCIIRTGIMFMYVNQSVVSFHEGQFHCFQVYVLVLVS